MPTPKLTPEIINAAVLGFEQQKRQIDVQIAELRSLLTGGPAEPAAATPEANKRKRRKMSAAGRKAIAEAQRKRWAASRGEAESVEPKPTMRKRKLSAAGRAAIVAATKARWDRVRAAKAKPAATKKAAVKKGAVKTAPAKVAKKTAPVKKSAVKKSPAKKTAPAPTQAGTETAA